MKTTLICGTVLIVSVIVSVTFWKFEQSKQAIQWEQTKIGWEQTKINWEYSKIEWAKIK